MTKELSEQQIANHLDWYFNDSASCLGFSSSYKSFERRMEGGDIIASIEPVLDERVFKSVKKFNHIHHILLQLTSQQRAILSATYDREVIIPPFLRRFFSKYAASACFTSILPIRELIKLFSSSSINKTLLLQIKQEARTLFIDTLNQYRKYHYDSLHH
jgi:hypothetical protein